jgi:hypothetical protein
MLARLLLPLVLLASDAPAQETARPSPPEEYADRLPLSLEQAASAVVFLHGTKDERGISQLGTGFLIASGSDLFLITAKHVAAAISERPALTFAAEDDRPKTIALDSLRPKGESIGPFILKLTSQS